MRKYMPRGLEWLGILLIIPTMIIYGIVLLTRWIFEASELYLKRLGILDENGRF